MSHGTTEHPHPAQSDDSRRPYAGPALTSLGAVQDLTAGDMSGTLDGLVGASGGFQDPDPDPTS